jgi:LAO/AO transport system kinase
VRSLHQAAGRAHLVGVTGPPGSGKSTLVAAMTSVIRASGRRVAVLAIDPSSPITGGAILGDRVRMQAHAVDEGVFIRSMAARGHAGGLTAATASAATVLDACGFELVLIETVGTGQSEVEVASVADTTLVIQAPEMGDEIQAIKAGLLEVADIVAVNKADRPGAERTASHLRAMLTVGAQHDRAAAGRTRPKRPDVLLVSGLTGEGVPHLMAAIDRRHTTAGGDGTTSAARLARARAQVEEILSQRAWGRLLDAEHSVGTEALIAAVAENALDPYAAADELDRLLAERSPPSPAGYDPRSQSST